MASATGGAQVDVHESATEPAACRGRDPTACRADGRGKLNLGLHAHSGCPQESRAPGRTLDDRAHLESPRSAIRADAPDVVADVSASALGSDRGGRFLYD